jgi:hypothetical protein
VTGSKLRQPFAAANAAISRSASFCQRSTSATRASTWRDPAAIPREIGLLSAYGIAPQKLRTGPGSAPVQGYLLADIEAAAVRLFRRLAPRT